MRDIGEREEREREEGERVEEGWRGRKGDRERVKRRGRETVLANTWRITARMKTIKHVVLIKTLPKEMQHPSCV